VSKTPAKTTAPDEAPAKPRASKSSVGKTSAMNVPPAPATHDRPAARTAAAPDAPPMTAPKTTDPKTANAWKTKAGKDLTEPELLAMPDGEYMNEKQLEFFRARLQALKDDLLSNAGETTEHLREDTSIVPDPADRATIEEEHALELRTRDRERKLLKKISQSIGRIDAGDYGYCDETGEPIGLGRLLARPTATLSLEAQQRREMKQKMFGD
jgi:DnaK suppressor protein